VHEPSAGPLFARLIACVLALVATACRDDGHRTPRAPSESSSAGPIRLVDLLDSATIEGPVARIAPAGSVDELGSVLAATVFQEDFEAFDPTAAGWPDGAGRVAAGPDERRAFRSGDPRAASEGRWSLPAEPTAHYVFERSVSASAALDVDLVVVETAENGQEPLKAHWPEEPEPDGTWQRSSISFFTTERTRALDVSFESKPRGPGEGPVSGTEPTEAWFDDVVLKRLEPTPEQRIALLKAASPAPGADRELGVHKRGQFLPLGNAKRPYGPLDVNFSTIEVLYAPPPSDLRFTVPVRPGAALHVSVCLSRYTPPGDAARFEVLVRDGDREERLWSRTLAAEDEDWRWHDARVDLADFAGRSVELVLRTRAEQGDPHPLWGHPVVDAPAPADEIRNVFLIAVDTLRADRLSCYGYEHETSPHLDALTDDGIRFEHVASNANWTCPSFASIFTGVVPSRHGVLSFGHETPLPSGFETLAERFRSRGWSTHSIAFKTALYGGGFDRGFDVSFNVPRMNVEAQDNLDEALTWLESHAGRRSFLFLHFNDPHQPFTQPAPFDRRYGPAPREYGIPRQPDVRSRNEEHRDVWRAMYDGEVAYVDDRIGAFLAELRERGLYDDAVIAFVSDHGEQLWEHGGFGHSQDMLHDEVVRVPLIVKPPRGAFPAGTVVETQVRGFDVMPTILELAGLPVEPGLDAESLVPLFDATDAPDRLAVTESSTFGIAVRSRKWKYIRDRRGLSRAQVRNGAVRETIQGPRAGVSAAPWLRGALFAIAGLAVAGLVWYKMSAERRRPRDPVRPRGRSGRDDRRRRPASGRRPRAARPDAGLPDPEPPGPLPARHGSRGIGRARLRAPGPGVPPVAARPAAAPGAEPRRPLPAPPRLGSVRPLGRGHHGRARRRAGRRVPRSSVPALSTGRAPALARPLAGSGPRPRGPHIRGSARPVRALRRGQHGRPAAARDAARARLPGGRGRGVSRCCRGPRRGRPGGSDPRRPRSRRSRCRCSGRRRSTTSPAYASGFHGHRVRAPRRRSSARLTAASWATLLR